MLRDELPDNTLAPLSIDVLGAVAVRLGDAELPAARTSTEPGAIAARAARAPRSVRRERISDLLAHGRQSEAES